MKNTEEWKENNMGMQAMVKKMNQQQKSGICLESSLRRPTQAHLHLSLTHYKAWSMPPGAQLPAFLFI